MEEIPGITGPSTKEKVIIALIFILIGIAVLALIVGCIVLRFYLWDTYGSLPWEEIPGWAKFFMFGK